MSKYQYGLIGWPLDHSFSSDYFKKKFDDLGLVNHSYKNFPLNHINQFPELILKQTQLKGLNVTIPYKEDIINFLDEIDPLAQEIGSVNCIKFRYTKGDFLLKGFNTDAWGFEQSIKQYLKLDDIKNALIIGNGGSSKAIIYILKQHSVNCKIFARNPEIDNGNQEFKIDEINEHLNTNTHLIINCTPIGMFPNNDQIIDLDYTLLNSDCFCMDLIYNPSKTMFLQQCEKQNCKILNGLEMLKYQADKSWEIWNS